MRLHSRVATERTAAALTNRELWQPALLFLSFDAGQLGPNQWSVNRTFLHLLWRLGRAVPQQPGDRVLVVFGSGHAFWLRHFVQNTTGFQLIEPRDYLE